MRAGTWSKAATDLYAWMAARDLRGWDPYDALASPLVRGATAGSRWLGVAWTQLLRRCPLQLRPLLRVPQHRNPKTGALVLEALERLSGESDDFESDRREVRGWLLEGQTESGGWGYPFPWTNRSFHAPAGTPSSVVTAFVGRALLDASGVDTPRDALDRAADFLLRDLARAPGRDGTFCFSYTPTDRRFVHNASVLAASLLARVGRSLDRDDAREAALAATRFTAHAQRSDGSWPYGVGPRDDWVDSFHTGYVLIGLEEVGRALGTDEFEETVDRGLAYWVATFLEGPAVAHRPGRPYPVDMHAVAHAILTLLAFRDRVEDGLARAFELGEWALAEMRADDGSFHYLRHRHWTNRLRYMRWVQAWMLRALSELAAVDRRRDEMLAGARNARGS